MALYFLQKKPYVLNFLQKKPYIFSQAHVTALQVGPTYQGDNKELKSQVQGRGIELVTYSLPLQHIWFIEII